MGEAEVFQWALLGYQLFITACLLVFLGILALNWFDIALLSKAAPSAFPRVSILVPARNEARSIESCIRSLCAQEYPNIEVIALNDQSVDETGEILGRLQNEFSILKVISGAPLPSGWVGKCWACHQLSKASTGDLLLFTDADTVHSPDSLARAVASLQTRRADMISLVPFQELRTVSENLIVPLVHFLITCFLPMRMIWQSRNTAFAFANGQYILFRRDSYERIGGHESVKANIVEDVWLVKAVKRANGRAVVFNGVDAVRCRMYCNFHEAWRGFSKNLFAGLNYNLFATLGVCLVMAACFVLPYPFAAFSLILQPVSESEFSFAAFGAPLFQIALTVLMRMLIALKYRLPLGYSALHGLSVILFIAIAINSMRWIYFRGGAEWKGRRYDFSKS